MRATLPLLSQIIKFNSPGFGYFRPQKKVGDYVSHGTVLGTFYCVIDDGSKKTMIAKSPVKAQVIEINKAGIVTTDSTAIKIRRVTNPFIYGPGGESYLG